MKPYTLSVTLFLSFLIAGFTAFGQESSSGGGGGNSGSSNSASSGSSSASSGGGGGGVGIVVGENYILKPSDVISVQVFQEPDLAKDVRIEGDGSVALALVGKVKVAGMTVAESQSLITDLYNRDFLVEPQVSVLVIQFSPKKVHILGSVNQPGMVEIPPDRELSLTEAIAGVGGVSRMGNPKKIVIKRIIEDGRAQQMVVDFSDIITDENSRDIMLQEGDTVWVPERLI